MISSSSYAQDGMTYRSLETKSRANMAGMAKICNPVLRERIHFFKWKLEWYFAILYAIQNTFLAILKKLHCWVVGSYVVFRLPVSCAQFHCSSTFLHGIRQIPARFIKTVMFSCQNDSFMLFFPGCGGSPLTSITTANYAVMRAWRNLLLVAVLRSNWSNVLLLYTLHNITSKITSNIEGNPNLRFG